MYKVFLVDDEFRIKERIMSIEEWETSPYSFCGEAGDGEMALSLINEIKPDIVIADIEMPFMNGLELTAILRATMPWIKVIFLSGHDEFEYAKEALKLGVSDYLLKPLRMAELKTVLDHVANSIEEEKKQSYEIVQLQSKLENVETLKKDHLFEKLISGQFASKDLLDQYNSYGIDILSKKYVILDIKIHINSEKTDVIDCLMVRNFAAVQLGKVEKLIWYYRTSERMIVLLRGDDDFGLKEQVFSLATSIKHAIDDIEGHGCAIGIGSIADRLSQVSTSYMNANKARTFLGELYLGQILYFEDIENNMLDTFPLVKRSEYQLSRLGQEDIEDYISIKKNQRISAGMR